jgi:hypothetical protein
MVFAQKLDPSCVSKIESFLGGCAAVIEDFWKAGRIQGISSSVVLADYEKVCADLPEIPAYEDICSFFCMSRAFAWSPQIAAHFLEHGGSIYFDRNDPFRGGPVNLFSNKRFVKKNPKSWGKVYDIGHVVMERTPAIQAADLLTWAINARHRNRVCGAWKDRLLALERPFLCLNESILRHPDQAQLARWKDLGLQSSNLLP